MKAQAKSVAVLSGGRSVMPLAGPLSSVFDLAFLYPAAAESFAKTGRTIVNLPQLSTPKLKADSHSTALRLFQSVYPAMDSGRFGDLMAEASGNEGLARTFEKTMEEWFPNAVFSSLARGVSSINVWTRLMEKMRVSVCVTHEDVAEDTKCMTSFFRARKVPTIHVPHAVYMNQWRGRPGNDIHDEVTAEWIAAAGPFQRDWYIERGAKPRKVVLTGLPHWDKWVRPLDKVWARNALHLPQDEPVVMYASSWNQATSAFGMHGAIADSYAAFLRVAAEMGSFQSIVKLHPSAGTSSNDQHKSQAEAVGLKGVVTALYLDIAMAASDLVVAVGPSNLLLEAAMCGRPSVSIDGFGGWQDIITTTQGDLKDAIEVGLSESWVRNFDPAELLEHYAYKVDGQATQRVLDLIKRIV